MFYTRPTLVLIFGAEGCRKEFLVQELIEKKNGLISGNFKDRDLVGLEKLISYHFVPTITCAPVYVRHEMEKTHDLFEVVQENEFIERFRSKNFDLCWKEFLDKQYIFNGDDICNDYVYKAIPNIEKEIQQNPESQKIIISLSNSSAAEEGLNFNPLMTAIKLYKDTHNLKIVFIRAPRETVLHSLIEKGYYKKDEIDTLLVHHEFIEKDQTVNTLRKYLNYNGNIPIVFVDITNNVKADLRRMINSLEGNTEEENEQFYESKQTARDYMQKHKINELLQYLLQQTLIKMPDDPRNFLIENLEQIKKKSATKILTPIDFETMFTMIDINNKGFVTYEQTFKTMINLKVSPSLAEIALKGIDQTARISKDQFVNITSKHLDILSNTPYE